MSDPTDLTHAAFVEVVWDPHSKRLWINTEHGNVFRAYNVGIFRIAPERIHDPSSTNAQTDDGRTFDDNFNPVG